MSIIRMINMEATAGERETLRCIDLVTGPILINHHGEYVQELRNTNEVSINGVVSDDEEGLLEEAVEILLHRPYGDN